jgi:dTDP-4-amino-4,6-dideoxygalactose transaminase
LQPAYAHLGHQVGSFPIAEKVVARIVSLPMYAEMTDAMVDEVAEATIKAAG